MTSAGEQQAGSARGAQLTESYPPTRADALDRPVVAYTSAEPAAPARPSVQIEPPGPAAPQNPDPAVPAGPEACAPGDAPPAEQAAPAPATDPNDPDRVLTEVELDRICLHNLLSACSDMIYFKDRQSRFLRVSRSAAEFTGTGPAAMLGKTVRDYFTPEHIAAAFAIEQEIMRTGIAVTDTEEPHLRPGTAAEEALSTSKQPLRDFDGRIIGTFGISRDITARKINERELIARTAELDRMGKELRTLLESSPDPMVRYDPQLQMTYANPAAQRVMGLPENEMLGKTNRELGNPEGFVQDWEAALREVLATGENSEREFTVQSTDRTRYFHTRLVPEIAEDGEVLSVLTVSRDLTDRRRIEEALADQAVRDPLTGLANRTLLVARIHEAVRRSAERPGRLAVLFLDLDRFKLVNDSLGHAAGDELLVAVAARLGEAARRADLVARFGGDEFVILCEGVDGRAEAAEVAERICRCLLEPFDCGGKPIHVRASIGIALATGPAATADALLRDADAAMYQVKASGAASGGYQFFEFAAHERALHRLDLEHDLRQAVERGEFRLVYQPVVDLAGGGPTGAEALIRWQHPVRGLLAPSEFVEVAEETDLIIPIGRWVLDEACRQLAVWNAQDPSGCCGLTMAVNLSNRQLSHHPDLVGEITGTLARHRIRPYQVCLEVTETAVHEASRAARSALAELSAAGVQIALDDYGTGYSSLGHLRDIPVNALKIDRIFIDGLNRHRGDDAIVVAVITLAHALGMLAVAEGVENPCQRERLAELGCDLAQGHLIAEPLTPPDFEKFVFADTAAEARFAAKP
ncbi:MAG TPA: EAL domain-containing protein [Actinocrinis sp.]|nr:EAL domain-containing protein [Actinocrinis sp.]